MRKVATVGNEELRGVVEEPGKEVGGDVEEGGEDGDEGEVREAGTEVAAGEEGEAEKGEMGAEVGRFAVTPAVAGEDVESERNGIKSDDEKKQRDEREKEVKDDDGAGEAGEGDDVAVVVGAFKAIKMDDLGGEEDGETEFGGVVEGENNVGNTSGEHGEEQEAVFGEDFGDIDKTGNDTADAKKNEEVVLGSEETKNNVDEEESDPEGRPDGRNVVVKFQAGFFVRGFGRARMVTIRSRN